MDKGWEGWHGSSTHLLSTLSLNLAKYLLKARLLGESLLTKVTHGLILASQQESQQSPPTSSPEGALDSSLQLQFGQVRKLSSLWGWQDSPVVGHLLSVHEALGSIPSIITPPKNERKENDIEISQVDLQHPTCGHHLKEVPWRCSSSPPLKFTFRVLPLYSPLPSSPLPSPS